MNYRTGFSLHRSVHGAFDTWSTNGCRLEAGRIALDAAACHRGSDAPAASGGFPYYSGGAYVAGEAESPEITADFPFSSCIPSWNADLPDGTWLELMLRARSAGVWTSWRSMGVWAPNDLTIRRHSVQDQDDEAAKVATDTLVMVTPAEAFQARVKLYTAVDASGTSLAAAMPSLRAFSLAYSDPKPNVKSLDPSAPSGESAMVHGVPRCSQMVYPNGGNVWCSPTSVSMVLGFWRGDDGPCDARVKAAVAGVYDRVFDGHGNWSFNAAYAGSAPGGMCMEAYVARFSGLDRLEPWIRAGVPVVLSVSWNNDEGRLLDGAPCAKSSGHLTTLVGFDERGDPIMNEPASPTNETVRRVYDRRQLEARWLTASGGAAYIIYPAGTSVGERSSLLVATAGSGKVS